MTSVLETGDKTVDQPMRPTRDEVYYFQTVIFQVDNTLFRVPKNAFNVPGSIFEAMFALPPTTDADLEGSTDEHPIVLNVDENQFRRFLHVICGSRTQNLTSEDWLAALDLATMWTFGDIQQAAVQALDVLEWTTTQNLKDVVLTAKRNNIAIWLKIAYSQLIFQRPFPFLELTAAPAVDWETIAQLLHIMHLNSNTKLNRHKMCPDCGFGKICCGGIYPMVDETFKAEFERMEETSITRGRIRGNKTVDQPMRPTRDEVYYFQNVTFQVGNTLFRVPRNTFNVPGTIFETMFTLPPTKNVEGSTDDNPIVLDMDEKRFRGFLRVSCGPRGQKLADEDWLAALDLATLWTFDDIRREAIQALGGWIKTQSLKQVVLTAKKYNIASWLRIAYTQLVMEPVRFDELTEPPAVDWETIARLLHVRQSTRITARCHCRTGKVCCGVVDPSVEIVFKAELESMKEPGFEEPPLPINPIDKGRAKMPARPTKRRAPGDWDIEVSD